jgi:pilus assembly protein CpaB
MKAARLVVLGIAVAAGGLAALLAGRSGDKSAPAPEPVVKFETVDVLVANTDLNAGTVLKPDEMRWQMWPAASAGASVIRKNDRPDAIEQLTGYIVRSSFTSGEPLQESRLVKANAAGYLSAILPGGMRAVATEINAETSAGGFVIPGDHVDVILTQRDREAGRRNGVETFSSETIINNVRVLAIDQTIEDKNGQKVVIGKTATLELSPRQAETLMLGKQAGTLSLALRSVVDTGKDANDNSDDDRKRSGVNMVRFGITTNATEK